MEIRTLAKRAACFILLFFLAMNALHAQEVRFIQQFSWKADPAALEYKIEVEDTENGKTLSKTTAQNTAEFSLSAGKYRYRVTAYKVLGKKASTSEWISFTVRASLLPKAGESEFSQYLSWKADPAALSYRVELQNTQTHDTAIFETESTNARLSLESGSYRYRVTSYNVLGKKDKTSDWISFDVFKAAKPEIRAIGENPTKNEENGKIALSVDIENITAGSTVELISENEAGTFDGGDESVHGKAGNETGRAETIYFDDVHSGKWRLKVTNPSGLSTISEPFEVKGNESVPAEEEVPSEPTESEENAVSRPYHSISLSLGVGLLFNPYDGTFFEQSNNVTYFGQSLVPAVKAQIQFLPFTFGRDHWGFSLDFDGTRLFYRADAFNQTTTFALVNANFVYHRAIFSDRLFLGLKAGGGLALVKNEIAYKDVSGMNIEIDYDSDSRSVLQNSARAAASNGGTSATASVDEGTFFYPCAHACLSLVWLPFTRLSFELGADFTHILMEDMSTGLITPFLAVGIMF